MKPTTEKERLILLSRTCANLNLRRAARAVSNYYDGIFLAACGLRASQISPLVALFLFNSPRGINELAAVLTLDRTTLTRNLKPLEEAGLVRTTPGDDRRTHLVELTVHGREVLLGVLPVWESVQERMVQGMGEEQYKALLSQLADISAVAGEEKEA